MERLNSPLGTPVPLHRRHRSPMLAIAGRRVLARTVGSADRAEEHADKPVPVSEREQDRRQKEIRDEFSGRVLTLHQRVTALKREREDVIQISPNQKEDDNGERLERLLLGLFRLRQAVKKYNFDLDMSLRGSALGEGRKAELRVQLEVVIPTELSGVLQRKTDEIYEEWVREYTLEPAEPSTHRSDTSDGSVSEEFISC